MGIKMIRAFGIPYLLQISEQVQKVIVTILQTDDDDNNDDIVGWEKKVLGTFQAQNISKSKLQGWPDFNSSVLFHF